MERSRIVSAYHNYLVDGKLEAELCVGGGGDFFFQAHRLGPGERLPLVSGRFFGPDGEFLLEVHRNVLGRNPHGFSLLEMKGGWAIISTSLEAILSAQVLEFQKGLLSIVRGILYDARGCKVVYGDEHGLHVVWDSSGLQAPLSLLGVAPSCSAIFGFGDQTTVA